MKRMKANYYITAIAFIIFFNVRFEIAFSQPKAIADSLFSSARTLLDENKNQQALEYFDQALDLYRSTGSREETKETLYWIGLVNAAYLGNWLVAETNWIEALELARQLNDVEKTAHLNGNLGIVYDHLGEYKKAENYYSQSLAYYKETGQTLHLIKEYRNLTLLNIKQSNFYEAGKYLSESEKTAVAGNYPAEMGQNAYTSGFLNYKKGNLGKAFVAYHKALDILGDSISLNNKAEIKNNIGMIYRQYNDTASAKNNYLEALGLCEITGNLDLKARILGNLGNLYKQLKEYLKAVDYHTQSLKLNRQIGNKLGVAIAFSNIASIYTELEDFRRAKNFYNKSNQIMNDIGFLWGKSQLNLQYGELYMKQEKYSKAGSYYSSAIEIAENIGAYDVQYKIYAAQAGYYLATNDTATAIQYLDKSIAIIEDIRKGILLEENRQNFVESVIPIYQEMVDLKLAQNQTEEAFTYYERMKARNIHDMIEKASVTFDEYLTAEEIATQKKLESRQRVLKSELKSYCTNTGNTLRSVELITKEDTKSREEYVAFKMKLLDRHPEIIDKLSDADPIDFNEAVELLRTDEEAAIVFMVREYHITCFVLRRYKFKEAEFKSFTINVTKKELEELTGNLVEDWELQHTEKLYKLLFEPIKESLNGVSQICIIPDSYLYAIPFQALKNPETNRYIIQDYAIYFDYSLSILKELVNIGNHGKENVLAFGNPDFSVSDTSAINKLYESLPKSEEEVITIGNLYGDKAEIYLKDQASEANYKNNAANYGIVHIATHGIFDEVNPMSSSLLLTAGNDEDGYLSAAEIIKMQMNSDLVVLSACETAKGIITEGEGMVSLSRAFLGARVPTIVASLWQVDDRSTKILMEEFHKSAIKEKNYTKALQEAQIHLLENTNYKNPFFWSPFVLIGDWR